MPRASDNPILRRKLRHWFRKHARPLPWRANRDPYAIWISEVMLQQTQVATVIPYFERFLARFPDLHSLAEADEQSVLRLWEGLGYYRRARDLCRSARLLIKLGHATIPNDVDLVRSLPGFGRYTTNAVLSQAYDCRLPILEANSQRVLCRLFGIDANPKEGTAQRQLWQQAEDLLPRKKAGDFNQALMELGALVCSAAKPSCEACPLAAFCVARRQNRQDELPRRAPPPKIVEVVEIAVVIRKRNHVLLVQRPDGGRWERMWEFPHHELLDGESDDAAVIRLLAMLGAEGKNATKVMIIRHGVTRFRITMHCHAVTYQRGKPNSATHHDVAWVPIDELHSYPLCTPQRRLAQFVQVMAKDVIPARRIRRANVRTR